MDNSILATISTESHSIIKEDYLYRMYLISVVTQDP